MVETDQNAEAVYGHFTIDQLRDLAAAVELTRQANSSPQKTREQVIQNLKTYSDQKRLALLAHRTEAITAYKHLVPLSMTTEFTDYAALRSLCDRVYGFMKEAFSPLPSDSYALQPQVYVPDDENERIFLKFAHQVDVWEMTSKTESERVRTKVRRRHILVATFRPKLGLATISFPGFTQGRVGGQRTTYMEYVKELIKLLAKACDIQLSPLNLKPAIDDLLEDPNQPVRDIKRTLEPMSGDGELMIRSKNSEKDAVGVMLDLLQRGGIQVTASVVRELLKGAGARDSMLLWQRVGVTTRIALDQELPEMLFIWSDVGRSMAAVEEVLRSIVRAESLGRAGDVKSAHREIEAAPAGSILRPAWLAQKFSLTWQQALQLLLEYAANSKVRTKYRINGDLVLRGYINDWVDSIAEIPSHLETADGKTINGRDPAKIEIAFQRVGQ